MFTKIKCTDTNSHHLLKKAATLTVTLIKAATLKAITIKYQTPVPNAPSPLFYKLRELDLEVSRATSGNEPFPLPFRNQGLKRRDDGKEWGTKVFDGVQ